MKSNKFIQNTELATLKNDGKASATLTLPSSHTIPYMQASTVIASVNFTVGTDKSEPYFIYEDTTSSGRRFYMNWHDLIECTVHRYNTIAGDWVDETSYARVYVLRQGGNRYQLRVILNVYWQSQYDLYDATAHFDSHTIKLYAHTFINPFNQ